MPLKINYACPHCNHETEVTVYPFIPAKTSGSPDFWHPDEGGENEPNECEKCGALFDSEKLGKIIEKEIFGE